MKTKADLVAARPGVSAGATDSLSKKTPSSLSPLPPPLRLKRFSSPPSPARVSTRSAPRSPRASGSSRRTASSSSSNGTARPWRPRRRPCARRRRSRGARAARRSSSRPACARRFRRWGRSRARRRPRSSWTGSSRRSAWASRVAGMEARWDVVVVGGGHAGCEAALASARLGRKTLLLTRERATIGRMSCNPAVGGLAKGQVVREIDALGGAMGLVADRTAIQFKVLNGSRGTAVRGLRCQSDKALYAAEMTRVLEATPNLAVGEGTAAGFSVRGGRLAGLTLEDGATLACRAAVVTTGNVPARPHPRGRHAAGSRPLERTAGAVSVGRAPGARAPPRADEDGDPASRSRWHRGPLEDGPRAGRREADRVFVPVAPRDLSPTKAGRLLAHAHGRGRARPHSGQPAAFPALFGPDRRPRAALLPVHRGQSRALFGEAAPPDLRRAGRALDGLALPQRPLDVSTGANPGINRQDDYRPRARRNPPAGLCRRVRHGLPGAARRLARDARAARASTSRDRSTARPDTRRPPARVSSRARMPRGLRRAMHRSGSAGTRPTSA